MASSSVAADGGGNDDGSEKEVSDSMKKLDVDETVPSPPPPPSFSFGSAAAGLPPPPPSSATTGGGFSFQLNAGGTAAGEAADEDDEDLSLMGEKQLPAEVLERVLGLKHLHESREKVVQDYLKERCSLEKKYRLLLASIYADRAAVVSGESDASLNEEDKKIVQEAGGPRGDARNVPDFWLTALSRNDAFDHYLEENDVEALKALRDIRCVDFDDMTGFTLEFEFSENSFFSNKVLTKTYSVPNLVDANGQPELEKIEGCQIDWTNPNDCLVMKSVKKRQKARRGKNAGQTRVVTKLEPQPSFFHFFDSISLPTDQDDDEDDEDDQENDDIRDKIANDVELAFAIRTQIIPNAILWFTGEAADDEDDDDDEFLQLGPEDDDDDEEEESD